MDDIDQQKPQENKYRGKIIKFLTIIIGEDESFNDDTEIFK